MIGGYTPFVFEITYFTKNLSKFLTKLALNFIKTETYQV